jgi:predicted aminopeptidase
VPGDSTFNEAFATEVEEVGLERWLIAQHRLEDLQRWQRQLPRSEAFNDLLLQTRERLQTLYRSDLPSAAMAARKQEILGQLKFEFSQLRMQWQGYAGYDSWFDRALSNADFVAMSTYQRCVPGFKRLLQQVDNDLPRFYEAVKTLARKGRAARQAVCETPVPSPAS